MTNVAVYVGDSLGRYGFPSGHPFGSNRMTAFWKEAQRQGLDRVVQQLEPVMASDEMLQRFHSPDYVRRVRELSHLGRGLLDSGDTPAFPGCHEAAATVVGCALDATRRIMAGQIRRAFVPIAGLHHARRDTAGGFCVFNDCGVVVETLRQSYDISRIAYVDIDAHHGDGVFYAYEDDPALFVADIHEDGRFLYPGTGSADETGKGRATGTKLNIPLPPGADDTAFLHAWSRVEAFLEQQQPEFFLMQCGADSLAGDPLAHLSYSPAAHAHAARSIVRLAERFAHGRVLAVGGGGYDRANLAAAWTAVVVELVADRAGENG